ncbi:MAG TPA: imidazole glycerol phosphate synthase subunit HisH [Blastocatellia bacterium]|nr:imidazole glycerol phosphate synthase subunit HisH [Blastocatellia bacterium]
MTIAIIDYGVGNLRSVEKAFTAQGIEAVVSRDTDFLRSADKLVLLGVGAFGYAMKSLREFGFDKLVIDTAKAGKPVLGICVGLQMLFDEGHEFGVHEGLGLLPGRVIRFADGVRVPHVGWNQIEMTEQAQSHPVFRDLPDRSFFYFVHSYYVEPENKSYVLSSTEYGSHFASVCGSDNVFGVQFHPEKSQAAGLKLIRNFAEL